MNESYWKLSETERHFNDMQAGIRNLPSGWMLAAFAAIALLLKTQEDVKWLASPAVLVGVVSFMATLGLLVLWINDQLVYQRLLNVGLLVALKLQHDHHTLPPVRTVMRYATENKSMSQWMACFYTIPMWGFLAISVAAVLLRKSIGDTSAGLDASTSLWVLLPMCAAQLCTCPWGQLKRPEVELKTRAAALGNAEFAALFDGTADRRRARLAEVVQRHSMVETGEGGSGI